MADEVTIEYSVEMNILGSGGTYDVIYPKTLGSLVSGKVSSASTADSATSASSCTGNSATATKLTTARTIQTNLASTSSASFNGTANITPGITGTLPIANGGTNSTSASSAIYNLMNGLSTRTAANLNSYASTTYIPCYYGSSGYKFPLSNIVTYIANNVSSSGGSISVEGNARIGNGSSSCSFSCSSNTFLVITWPAVTSSSSASTWGLAFCTKISGTTFICSVSGTLQQGGYAEISGSSWGLSGLTSYGITAINSNNKPYDYLIFTAG